MKEDFNKYKEQNKQVKNIKITLPKVETKGEKR